MTLSVILISQNNENTIEKCFDSISEISDNIYLLDLYSTDDTIKKVEKYKFSSINYNEKASLVSILNNQKMKISDDYILFMYAYEIFDKKHNKELKDILEEKNESTHGYIIKVFRQMGLNNENNLINYSCRLFKNHENYQFNNDYFLDVTESIFKQDKKVITSDIELTDSRYRLKNEILDDFLLEELQLKIKSSKQNNGSLYFLALSLYNNNKYKNVVETLKRIDPKNIDNKAFLASVYNLIAKALIEQGLLVPATQILRKSLDMVYEQHFAHIALSDLYYKSKKYTEACSLLEIFNGNSGLDPIVNYYKKGMIFSKNHQYLPFVLNDIPINNSGVELYLGIYYISEGRINDGITVLNSLIEEAKLNDYEQYRAYNFLSKAYEIKNDPQKSYTCLSHMIKYDTEKMRKRQLFDHLKRIVLICVNENRYEDLARFIQIGSKTYKYSIFFYYFKAYVYYKQRKYDYAINELDNILEVYQDRRYKDIKIEDIFMLKADNYFDNNKLKEAIETYKSALKFDQKKVDALYKVGKSFELLQQKDAAKQIYERVLKIDDGYTAAKQDLDNIERLES